jgi:hypothetical protein
MKRLLILVFCIVAYSAAAASAATLTVYSGGTAIGTISETTTTNGGGTGYDKYVFKAPTITAYPTAGLTVLDCDPSAGTSTPTGWGWSTSGTGKYLQVPSGYGNYISDNSGVDWTAETLQDQYLNSEGAHTSNMSTLFATVGDTAFNWSTGASYASGTPYMTWYRDNPGGAWTPQTLGPDDDAGNWGYFSTTNATLFQGEWQTSTALTSSQTLATMYATTGAVVAFTGQIVLNGVTNPIPVTFSTGAVPEPSALALLATGLIGLAAYAWKKRK